MVAPQTLGGLTLVVWILSVIGGVITLRSLEDDSVPTETVRHRARIHAGTALLTGVLIILWFLHSIGFIQM